MLTAPRVFLAQPTFDDWSAVNYAIKESNDRNLALQNDWETGYWVAFAGGKPSSYGGGEYNNLKQEGVLLTIFNQPDCSIIKSFETRKVWWC